MPSQIAIGLVPDAYFFRVTKLYMVARGREQPTINPTTSSAGTIDSRVLWNLTGACPCYRSLRNASRTMLMNLDSRRGDLCCSRFVWHPRLMPKIQPSMGKFITPVPFNY